MSLWVWILLLAALIKLPLAGLMLWLPYRYDESMRSPEPESTDSEEDGGSKALPASPLDPHPRGPLPRAPRRGPHCSPSVPAPARMRTTTRRRARVRVSR
ncbi:MAG TPA: hypothetical protein VFY36_12350 [Solirubrobacteraceae bacterium]|nr:hypothetical protein [Solirubrobacteraceae bacterium]